ncbi:imidazolonepropionase [Balneola vulgaris]|uniref:imidazolonepropionase n=1 Tax=Balneola vulgaris TaxID=287535 RepID=UPI000382D2A5|nr:imidazolonepropionase [Balneola vulgaris]
MSTKTTLYGPFNELLTLEGIDLHGSISDEDLVVEKGWGVLVKEGLVHKTGSYEQLFKEHPDAHLELNGENKLVAMPAFIDSHTHICYGGNRAKDYAQRVSGKSYLEIAAAGGGIMDTVRETRKATEEELVQSILAKVEEHKNRGIATIEVKSGYGLNVDDELKMLRAIKKANALTCIDLIPTFLGAHLKPSDYEGDNASYLKYLMEEVVPVIQEEDLAQRADIFVEEGAFTIEEARHYAKQLKVKGFDMTMHVDQFHNGGAELAVDEGCVSADHLECTTSQSASIFDGSETVAVALPGASLGLGMQYTPARSILDQNGCLAIASDWNPGSAPMGDLVTQAAIMGAAEKLSIAETLAAITFRAARALRIPEGRLTVDHPAKLVVFDTDDYRNILYKQGQLRPSYLIVREECYELPAAIV